MQGTTGQQQPPGHDQEQGVGSTIVTPTSTPAAAGSVGRAQPSQRWQWLRLALAAAVVLFAALAPIFGVKMQPLGSLVDAGMAGRAHDVTVAGALGRDSTGSRLIQVRWTEGGRHYLAEAVQERAADGDGTTVSSAELPRIKGDVTDYLRSATGDQSLQVGSGESMWSDGEVMGYRFEPWLAALPVLWAIGMLVLLAAGPEPWWATRWAWVWVVLGPWGVLGSLAFLAMSGPPPGLRIGSPVHRRVTGWVMLVAVLVVSGVWRGVTGG